MSAQANATMRAALLSAVSSTVGAGGTLEVWTGAAPGVGNAATGTKLSTLTGVTFGSATTTMTMSATADGSAAASGTPGYVRLKTSGGTAVWEFDAAVGSGTFNFSGTVSLGGTVTLSSATWTAGNP